VTAVAPRPGLPRAPEQGARRRAGPPAIVVVGVLGALALLGSWVLLAASGGGYFPRHWLPAGLLCTGLVLVAWPVLARVGPRSHTGIALLALAGFVAWSFASIAWAASPGAAWEASNQWVAVLAGAALAAAIPWTARTLGAFCAAWAVAVAVTCGVDVVHAAGSHNPIALVIDRYPGPLGYANASAAFAAMAAWPALALASGDVLPRWTRPVVLAASAVLLEFTLLPASRGALLALLVAAPVLLLTGRPARLLVNAAIVAAALAASAPAMLRVGDSADEPAVLPGALDAAARTMGLSAIAVLAAGILVATLGPRLAGTVRLPSAAPLRRPVRAAVVVALAAGALVAVANAGQLATAVQDRWDTARSGAPAAPGEGRLLSIGPYQRPDYWRVALRAFADAPVLGIGAGGYERRYTAERRYAKHSRYAHDLWLRALAEGGLVALALLLAAIASMAAGLARVVRRTPRRERATLVACIAPAVVFGVHASLDWLDEYLVLAGPAFALPLAALRLGEPPPARATRSRTPAALAVGLAGLLALASMGAAWVAVRDVDRGTAQWSTDRAGALRSFHRAERWDPLSPVPGLTEAGLALTSGDLRTARRALERSLAREETWKARFELALLAAHDGRFAVARAHLRRAQALNAHDPALADTARALRERRRIDPPKFLRELPVSPLLGAAGGA
jgi:O-Antigen ligase